MIFENPGKPSFSRLRCFIFRPDIPDKKRRHRLKRQQVEYDEKTLYQSRDRDDSPALHEQFEPVGRRLSSHVRIEPYDYHLCYRRHGRQHGRHARKISHCEIQQVIERAEHHEQISGNKGRLGAGRNGNPFLAGRPSGGTSLGRFRGDLPGLFLLP